MKKFWSFIRNEDGGRVLRLEGPVDEESFWGNEITPREFREELDSEDGDVTVWINSPGGNVFAAAEIYTMLCDHKGRITVKIDAIAASAASVIAMAGDRVLMSPVAMLMIHDPMTIAMGNAKDMEMAISTLNEVKASIINAYQKKTGLSRSKISQLMENETWMNAKKAVEMGFADEILFTGSSEGEDNEKEVEDAWQPYSTRIMGQTILNWLVPADEESDEKDEKPVADETEAPDVETSERGLTEQPEISIREVSDSLDLEIPTEETECLEGNGYEPDIQAEAECRTEELSPEPDMPMIGMNGKTENGSMPYELLKKQLDFLR